MAHVRKTVIEGIEYLQTPVFFLTNGDRSVQGLLVLNVHVGDCAYHQKVVDLVNSFSDKVYFEGVKASEKSGPESEESKLLTEFLQLLYNSYLTHPRLVNQRSVFTYKDPKWVHADITMEELGSQVRTISIPPHILRTMLEMLKSNIAAMDRDPTLRASVQDMQINNMFMMPDLLQLVGALANMLPPIRKFTGTIIDYRDEVAVRTIFNDLPSRFSLIYGAGHGTDLLERFAKRGFTVAGEPMWLNVISRPYGGPSSLFGDLIRQLFDR